MQGIEQAITTAIGFAARLAARRAWLTMQPAVLFGGGLDRRLLASIAFFLLLAAHDFAVGARAWVGGAIVGAASIWRR